MRFQVNKPILTYFFLIYSFISFICLYVKIVSRNCYSSYGSVNLTMQQVETSRNKNLSKRCYPCFCHLFVKLSSLVFGDIFQTTFLCSTCSIKNTVVGCNKLLILGAEALKRPLVRFSLSSLSWYSRKEYRFCFGKLIGSMYIS